jgi:hypothetical protein
VFRRSWGAWCSLLLTASAALCAALVWWVGYVKGSHGWPRPATADSGDGVAKGAPEPAPLPPPTLPPPTPRLHVVSSRGSPPSSRAAAPMGSLEPGSPKRRDTSSKVTAISPTRSGSCASWGATGPGACRPAGSRSQSVICAPPVAKRPA